MGNISKFVQLNDFVLLEYEFNRDGTTLNMSSMQGVVARNLTGAWQFYNQPYSEAVGETNNVLEFLAVPTDVQGNHWLNNSDDTTQYSFWLSDSSIVTDVAYPYDTVKLHVVSGYNFEDIAGFMMEVKAERADQSLVDLNNFLFIKQPGMLGSADVFKFSTSPLFLGNRYYDKYLFFKVPSVFALSGDTISDLGQILEVKALSDVHVTFNTVATIQTDGNDNNTFTLSNSVDLQLPVTSVADSFNAFVAESPNGDFIEYYAMWDSRIIGERMGDIESGRIPLSTSSTPNDDYLEFSDIFGSQANKWVLIHELYLYEQIPGGAGSSLLTQKYAFTQDSDFSEPNYFRPVLKYADLAASYTIQYVCRLSNRMDGTQIIRKASFFSTDPKKYGFKFERLNVDNILPYKVFNRIPDEKPNVMQGGGPPRTKYIRVYYDTVNVILNEFNEVFPNGLGPLFLKGGDALYKFKFQRINQSADDERENVDLSGAFNYALLFVLDDGREIEVVPTYSKNMNTTLGELEFKLTGEHSHTLLMQTGNQYSVVVKNPDGTRYVFYEGMYYDSRNQEEVLARFEGLTSIAELNLQIGELEEEIRTLQVENEELRSNFGIRQQ